MGYAACRTPLPLVFPIFPGFNHASKLFFNCAVKEKGDMYAFEGGALGIWGGLWEAPPEIFEILNEFSPLF